jgi:hypothetical protein
MFIAGEKLVYFIIIKLLLTPNILCDFKAAMDLSMRIDVLQSDWLSSSRSST